MEKLIQDYTAACPGATIDYTTSGSGAGVKAFLGGGTALAGSDSPLHRMERDGVIETDRAARRCQGNAAWSLPLVFSPIAVAHNVDGVTDLNLTGELIARIFDGDITRWDDPAIAAANPGTALPDARIAVFYRADESGTTENFTRYLNAAATDIWAHDSAKKWPASRGEGKEKTAGVADAISGTPNSITYLEWGAALERDLKVARVNGVELSGQTASRTVAAAAVEEDDGGLRLGFDYSPDGNAYPLVMATYKIVCSAGGPSPGLVRDFLGMFASEEMQASLEGLGYAPLPGELRERVNGVVSAIQ
jgi:phosphate ABC transporter,  phosphate-binding protein pstS